MAAATNCGRSTTPSNDCTTSGFGRRARDSLPVAFEILGKRCEIGERLVDLTGVSRPPSSAPPPRNLLRGSGGEQLLVQGGEATSDLRPAVPAALCLRAAATHPAFLLAASGADERVGERLLVVGRDEPARPSVGDDRRRARRPAGDHREATGHRLDQDEPERLGDGGQDERVGGVQRLRQLLVRAPASEEDLAVSDPPRRGERMLPLPLARMAADEYERRRPAEQPDSTRVGADQERQALDRRVATDVEEDRAAGPEGSELLVAVGDAPRPPALVPAARLLDQPAAPKREPLLLRERSPREALKLDATREAAQPRPLEAEQEGRVRLRPGLHDQEGAVPRPGSQPPAPSPGVAP